MHIHAMTLQEWMIKQNLTDAALATRLEGAVSRSQINRIRRGKCRPGVELAKSIAKATGLDAAALVMGEAR